MKSRDVIYPLQLVVNLFSRTGKINWRLLAGIVSFSLFQYTLLLVASCYDNTLFLPGVGKGLFEHYGVWAIITTDPLLLISTSFAYSVFRRSLADIPLEKHKNNYLKKNIIKNKVSFLLMKPMLAKAIYCLLLIVGVLAFINNTIQTCDPVFYYGNDVFDGYTYTFGYFANKINLFLSWVVVYPIVAFFCIGLSVCTFLILREFKNNNLLRAEIHHPDKCFGYSKLGTLNVSLMLPFFLTYEVIFFLMATHERNYLSLIVPIAVVTVVFLVASFIVIYPLNSFVNAEGKRLSDRVQDNLKQSRFTGENPSIMTVLDSLYLSMMHGSPYSHFSKYCMYGLRMITVSMTGYKAFVLLTLV